MAKAKKKKKNYRMRKSVRRTLGALFMISAIIIAAIPFPDAAAEEVGGGEPPAGGSGSGTTSSANIAYGVTEDDFDEEAEEQTDDLKAPAGDPERAYVLIKDGTKYSYKWQFEYFVNDEDEAIITKYNDGYTVEEVTLDEVNNNVYVEVKESGTGGYNAFFDDGNSLHSYTYTYDDWSATNKVETAKILEHYFSESYTEFITACKRYSDEQKKAEPDPSIGIPNALSKTKKDITNKELRKEYFLQFGFEEIPDVDETFDTKKYVLQDVLKPVDKSTNQNSNVNSEVYYIVKLNNPKDSVGMAKFSKDSNGFLFKATMSYPIVGIGQDKDGNGAFEGVNTYLSLTLPANIKFIADRAFKGSNITEVTINGVEIIGNQAFQNSLLEKINWGIVGTKRIGAEAFRETQLTSITVPYTVTNVGAGAFSYNKKLTKIDIDDRSVGVNLGKYAFFECEQLGSLDLTNDNILTIGEGCFAMAASPKGNFTSFKFPRRISGVGALESDGPTQLSEYILAGRTNLQTVVMPEELGRSVTETLPKYIFYNCSGLKCVEFPDESDFSGYIKFDKDTFRTVRDPEFYVKGPKLSSDGEPAQPRKSTWKCTMNDGSSVPYVYEENGKSFHEVCQDEYLLSIDSKGMLQRCSFVVKNGDDIDISESPGNTPAPRLIIPGSVGKLPIKGIADGCFTETFLQNVAGPLVIMDGGELKEIEANVFAGATFTHVYIGDSVEKIGAGAFADCRSLTQVTIGKKIVSIGDSAFKGCMLLNQVQFVEPDNLSTLKTIGNSAFATGKPGNAVGKLVFIGAISPDYVPFKWAMATDNYVDQIEGVRVCYKTPAATAGIVLNENYETFTKNENENTRNVAAIKDIPTNLSVILDNTTKEPTLVDYQHYSDIAEEIREAYETQNSEGYNMFDEQQIQSAFHIVVPEGVTSIDAKQYFNDNSNEENITQYFANDGPEGNEVADSTKARYKEHGLFAGTADVFEEFPNGNEDEENSKGNDRIKSVVLHSVKYLPDQVFDDCENLETVQVGKPIEELGSIPFSNCDSLSSVSFGNDKFKCTNGIIYEKLDDGKQKLVECLASRGSIVGSSTVSLKNDPTLADVKEIADAAFKDCKNINSFDLTDVKGITKIPDECFEGAKKMNKIILPEEIRKIGDEAFATGGDYLQVTVKGREVGLGDNAFGSKEEGNRVTSPYLISHEDSAVRFDAADQGADVEEVLDQTHAFSFYDETGTNLLKIDYVKHGDEAQPPKTSDIPQIAGKEFVGWNKSLENIVKDDFTLAVYKAKDSDSGDGSGSGSGNGSGNGSNNGNGGSSNNGSSNNGTNVNGGIDKDGDGVPDVDKDGNKLYKLTVTDGEGGGYYKAGQTVTIKAGNAPKGTSFAYWSCSNESLIFDDYSDWITTLTMIASDVTVVCNFEGQYRLEVEYGSGSGSYAAGAKVAISAVEAPQGRKFASWKTDNKDLTIESSTKESTVITMPRGNAKVTATYMDVKNNTVSGNTTPSKNNTSIIITKPGISDKDKASAYVSGSSDNFIVKISESLDAADEVQRALQEKYPDMSRIKYFAMDISLYDAKGENKITNTNGLKVNITIPIPDALKEYAGNNRVGAVVNGELEALTPKFTTIDGVPSISFTATHFSPYTVYVDTGNMVVSSTLDTTPKTGDIHPKWFLSLGLACISIILFTKKDRRYTIKA